MTTTSTYLPIDIGSAPNDGSGNNIRDAFNKVNANFANIYEWAFGPPPNTAVGIRFTDLLDAPSGYNTSTYKIGSGPILVGSNNAGTSLQNWEIYGTNGITVTSDASTAVVRIEATGGSGYAGSKGYTGSVGYTGSASTVAGYFGSVGYTGSIGAGYTGSASTGIGYTGSGGDLGYTGSGGGYTGSTGYTGSSAGYTGSASTVPGYTGSIGYYGSVGYFGSFGDTGYTGSLGYYGSIGYTGSVASTVNINAYASGTYYPTMTPEGLGTQSLYTATSVYFNGSTLTAPDFTIPSDLALKDVVGGIPNALGKLESINGISYYWNDQAKLRGILSDRLQIGVVAQEVKAAVPEIVSEHDGSLTVNYDKLIPILIEAVKELNKKIDKINGAT